MNVDRLAELWNLFPAGILPPLSTVAARGSVAETARRLDGVATQLQLGSRLLKSAHGIWWEHGGRELTLKVCTLVQLSASEMMAAHPGADPKEQEQAKLYVGAVKPQFRRVESDDSGAKADDAGDGPRAGQELGSADVAELVWRVDPAGDSGAAGDERPEPSPTEDLADSQYAIAHRYPGEYVVLVGTGVIEHTKDRGAALAAYRRCFQEPLPFRPVIVAPDAQRGPRPLGRGRTLTGQTTR